MNIEKLINHFIKITLSVFLFSSCGNLEKQNEPKDEIAQSHDKFISTLSVSLTPSDSVFLLGDSINYKVHFYSNKHEIPDSMFETRYILDSIFDPEWPWDSVAHPYFISENNKIQFVINDSGKHFISIHCLYHSDAGFNKVKNHSFFVNGKSSKL